MIYLKNFKRFFRGLAPFLTGGLFFKKSYYSQDGEDIMIKKLFPKSDGFYVDIGAHHPFRFSNSFLFYKMGWTGVCVDPLPSANLLFKIWRKRYVFLPYGVGLNEGMRTYFMFSDPALNTFDESVCFER